MRRRRHVFAALGLLAPACTPAPTAHRGPAQRSSAVSAPQSETPDAAGPGADSVLDADDTGPASIEPVTLVTVTVDTTTTTFVLPEAEEEETDEQWWASQPGYQPSGREALLACIRRYEQGAAGYASDTGNGFYGAYQFTLGTWRSVGGSGNPAHASPAEQDARAWALYQRRGLYPWPTPARRCG